MARGGSICGGSVSAAVNADVWYLSEGWMLGRRVSPLGEVAKPRHFAKSYDLKCVSRPHHSEKRSLGFTSWHPFH
jgi:hypothetical protein